MIEEYLQGNTAVANDEIIPVLQGGLQYNHYTEQEDSDYYVENEIDGDEGYSGDSMELAAEYKRKYDEEQKQKALEQAQQNIANKTNSQQSSSTNWIIPVNARVSSPYGWRIHPITKVKTFHNGVDFAANTGDIIKAPMSGTVTFAAYQGPNGNCVRINHGTINGKKVTSTHIHLNTINVKVGQQIKQGHIIGTVGSTGKYPNGQPSSTGPHLHLSVYENGQPVDPFKYINKLNF